MEWDIQNQKSKELPNTTQIKKPSKVPYTTKQCFFVVAKYHQISTQNLPLLPISLKKTLKLGHNR
jgi:hypothetical protein